ncbi:lysine decarboxylase domain-containing protein [Trypanosoma conorhini]|uniref:Lysine decarboxylase domain-containing protein n=1 Tax=Trypanosoma conorhini TaxID=83891 RepID=A0A3R7L5Y6_9TRYP|nr:lysine decarboxylase domain-containing protein [Trypanosoma conorhini]RNF21706.1 lysine decarboxylase domain-containing protein [Trypanosoma conorhini]
MTAEEHKRTMQKHEASLAVAQNDEAKAKAERELHRLQRMQWTCEWVDKVRELSRLIAEFAVTHRKLINASFTHIPDYFRPTLSEVNKDLSSPPSGDDFLDLVVTTGGGPGFMEAANKGAASVEGSATMGMGISLPFEKGLNRYITQDLAFEFHYFFTRKFWMMYSCRAIVVAPGGLGTLDELFELLTLRQTGKIPELPIVLFCSKFWKTVVNWEALLEFGTVSREDVDTLCFADTAQEAVEFIKNFFWRKRKFLWIHALSLDDGAVHCRCICACVVVWSLWGPSIKLSLAARTKKIFLDKQQRANKQTNKCRKSKQVFKWIVLYCPLCLSVTPHPFFLGLLLCTYINVFIPKFCFFVCRRIYIYISVYICLLSRSFYLRLRACGFTANKKSRRMHPYLVPGSFLRTIPNWRGRRLVLRRRGTTPACASVALPVGVWVVCAACSVLRRA